MKSLSERETLTSKILESYAVPLRGTLGREHQEQEDDTRFPFQRDRDRILHTQAFRRLKHKTQVFVSGHGDHYRTRITHTLEVAQISRDIARTFSLNEDLAECIALAHDLGHTPFGHAGEEAMNACMQEYGQRFEHNEQSLRIVCFLEERSTKYLGLNLNKEILEGLMKHADIRPEGRWPSLEAALVNLADEIAYTAHDTDDGLRAGMLAIKDVRSTKLGSLAYEKSQKNGTEIRGAIVDLLVTDVYAATSESLQKNAIKNIDDVYQSSVPLVMFSAPMAAMLSEHRAFLWERVYKSPAVLAQAEKGKQTITKLFHAFMQNPSEKVKELQKKTGDDLCNAVKDYIAGMTDTYAVEAVIAY